MKELKVTWSKKLDLKLVAKAAVELHNRTLHIKPPITDKKTG